MYRLSLLCQVERNDRKMSMCVYFLHSAERDIKQRIIVRTRGYNTLVNLFVQMETEREREREGRETGTIIYFLAQMLSVAQLEGIALNVLKGLFKIVGILFLWRNYLHIVFISAALN